MTAQTPKQELSKSDLLYRPDNKDEPCANKAYDRHPEYIGAVA